MTNPIGKEMVILDFKKLIHRHAELWKFAKFIIVGGLSTVIELVVYYILQGIVFRDYHTTPFHIWIFQYEGIGYFWSFLISTAVGYTLAFIFNRKVTFHADANPALSIFLYVLMVLLTICATTWMGTALLDFCIVHDQRTLGEIIAKPLVAVAAVLWTYPINRFLIHRRHKTDSGHNPSQRSA